MKTSDPAVKLRDRFIQDIDGSILLLDRLQNGDQVNLCRFRLVEDGTLEFTLFFGGRQLALPKGDAVLRATTFDDLVEQLDQIKIITSFGGLDEALSRSVNDPDID